MKRLVHIPFHDFRKCSTEGFRSRDTHLIEHFIQRSENVGYRYCLVNRPLLLHNLVLSPIANLKYRNWKSSFTKNSDNFEVFDSFNRELWKPIFQKRKFIWNMYKNITLDLSENDLVFTQNLYAAPLIEKNVSKFGVPVVFDAFDNWEKLPFMSDQIAEVEIGYQLMAKNAKYWTTNSLENAEYFKKKYGVNDIRVIRNGVDIDKFRIKRPPPKLLADLESPIYGFAGKLTHLVDVDLLLSLAEKLDKGSIVLIGQIVEKNILKSLEGHSRIKYLGDKSYMEYVDYVTNFDVCLIPYHFGDKAHGGDSIKFYEYLATGRPIVATPGNGITDIYGNVSLCENTASFSDSAIEVSNNQSIVVDIPNDLTWSYKVAEIESILGL